MMAGDALTADRGRQGDLSSWRIKSGWDDLTVTTSLEPCRIISLKSEYGSMVVN
jgi:hypothetical protein